MTRTYALKRLLEHGAMRRAELIECTGWEPKQLDHALECALRQGVVFRALLTSRSGRGNAYRAASHDI